MKQVSLCKTESYNQEALDGSVGRHFAALDVKIPAGARVVLKPNLIRNCPPQRAATTHPALVEAVIRQLQGMGVADITIADSPGGAYTPQRLAAVYGQTGMKDAAERCGVKLNFDCGSRPLHVQGALCREFDIISPVADADVVINLCKLKTHCMTTMSCGVKNLFGCVPGLLKPQLHYRFPEMERFARMMVDLSLLVRPALTIVDAVDAMEGNGPTGGEKRHLGFTAAAVGEGLYALDLVLARQVGLGPDQVPILAETVARGLCPADAARVELVGDLVPPVEQFKMPDSKRLDFSGHVPRPVAFFLERYKEYLAPKPKIRRADCIGCGRCAESCPADTIAVEHGKARIDPARCIRCFCCHEMCPALAIDIKSLPFFQMFSK